MTVPDVRGWHTPKSFVTSLFNYWGVGDPCDNAWFGITCNAGNTAVQRLIINDANNIVGPLPASMFSIATLRDFDLSNQGLTGTLPALGVAPLQYLNVSDNQRDPKIDTKTHRKYDEKLKQKIIPESTQNVP